MSRKAKYFALAVIAIAAVFATGQDKRPESEYVGSQACFSCHASKHSPWKSSSHAKPSESIPGWSNTCAGCHTTNPSADTTSWSEADIGCEACHGPGREHAATGDKSKIVSSRSEDICGQCHIGTGWVAGFRPGMKLAGLPGLKLVAIDSAAGPPESGPRHRQIYNMWLSSGHSETLKLLADNKQVSPQCYSCHSAEGFQSKLAGKTVDLAHKESFHAITCSSCHDSHNSSNPHQLVADPEKVCTSCHSQRAVLEGKGAKGIDEIRGVHSAVDCFSCHMTGGNHLMKVLRPDDPGLPEKRLDTCTTCHKDNNRKARAGQLQEWQASYKEAMDPLQVDLNTVNAALKNRPRALDDNMKAKLNNVKFNLSLITKDGSRGAHNPDFVTEIMAIAAKELREIKAAIK
jgi:predicted CXXCH cytochrome family protein